MGDGNVSGCKAQAETDLVTTNEVRCCMAVQVGTSKKAVAHAHEAAALQAC